MRSIQMIDPNQKNDLVLKLSGKAEIPSELEIGHNYELKAQGTITSKTEADKNDGSHVIYYKFEPIVIELVTDKGESIKAKDPRTKSQLWRSCCWKIWNRTNSNLSFEDFYDNLMNQMLQHYEEIIEMYAEKP